MDFLNNQFYKMFEVKILNIKGFTHEGWKDWIKKLEFEASVVQFLL